MGAEIVEQEDFGIERRLVGFAAGGVGRGVVAGFDFVEQRLVIAEEAFKALGHDLAQGGYREVRLAASRLADEQESGTLFVGEVAHELLDGEEDGGEFAARGGILVAGYDEVIEGSFAIEGGDLRTFFQARGAALGAAIARRGAG